MSERALKEPTRRAWREKAGAAPRGRGPRLILRAGTPALIAPLALAAIALLAGCGEPTPPSPIRELPRVMVIKEMPGEARIDGLGSLAGFAKGRDCSFLGCLEVVLDAVGRPVGYDELMGLSGAAFRLQFRLDHWDVGNPDPLAGESCLPRLFTAIGWEYDVRTVRREDIPGGDALRKSIQQSIERGWPVLAANIIPPEDWGLITGYKRDRNWLCRSYNGEATKLDLPATGWPTAVVILTRQSNRPTSTEAHADSVRHAIELFEKPRSGEYAVGDKAFDMWCQQLSTARERSYIHPNFWTYIGLIDARAAAVRYLRSIAREFGARDIHLNMAADWYDKEVRLLLSGLENVPAERRFPDALPPYEMRIRQSEILRQAQSLERSAIDSLKKAM